MEIVSLASVFLLGVFAVVAQTLYTASYGPLGKLPGPWYAKFTSLRLKYENCRGNGIHYIHAMHMIYGPYVRLSPRKVAVSDIDAVKEVHAIPTKYPKPAWYHNLTGRNPPNLFTMLDIKAHGHRRRLLASQLSETSLREQEPTVKTKILSMLDRMADEQAHRGFTNIAVWSIAMTNDLIGQLSFGIPFGTLDTNGYSDLCESVRLINHTSCWLAEFPILANPTCLRIPLLHTPLASTQQLRANAGVIVKKYLQTDPKDLGPTLFKKLGDSSLTERDITQEAVLYMIAGTNTTANTLSYLIWVLAQHPALQARLRTEIRTLAFDNQAIKSCTYIENLIDETLRLYGAASAPLPRCVPSEGAHMGSYYMPPGTDILTQAWTMHRNASIFAEPEEFKPERWEKPTRAMLDSFFPFGGGARSCLGMHLARMELRLALYAFFTRFDKKLKLAREMQNEDMESQSFLVNVSMKRYRCLINIA